VAHTGFGSSLFLPFLYDAPVINFLEFLYSPIGQDLGFRPEIPVGETELLRSRTNNAMILLDLLNCDRGWTPTHYQRDFFPPEWRSKIEVIFDGIDTDVYHRKEGATERIREMYKIDPSHRIVSYVARGFEMIRGFDVFIRAAKIICEKRRDVTFVVVGTDKVHYGSDLKYIKEATFRHQILADEKPDLSRFRFVGYVQQEVLADVLSATDVHLYLTEPFIASWSMVDAMACQAVLIASDQTCVREYVVPGENGLLVNFFDHQALAEQTLEVLADPSEFRRLAKAAARTVEEKFSLNVGIPKIAEFFRSVASRPREPSLRLEKLARAGTLKLITSDPEELARKAKITESPTGQPMTRTVPADALTPASGAQESAVAMIRELGEKARTVPDWVRLTLGFSAPAPYASIGPRNHPSDLNRLLRRLAEWKAKVIVDVGEREGGAFFLFAQMATETARVIVTGCAEHEIPADRLPLIEVMPRPRQTLAMIPTVSDHPSLARQIEMALDGERIDFLFLHGRRPYTPLSADYQSLTKLVRPGGLIAWDGIGPATAFGPDRDGGHRLWIEVQSTFPQRAEYLNGCATEYGGMAMIKI
ncbi:MAG TPA: glycosyltransferase, partial [Tepidisphaeraceae bacterium]|nr:glycosyltransferase [Tepidisphaeraceae bacterium]